MFVTPPAIPPSLPETIASFGNPIMQVAGGTNWKLIGAIAIGILVAVKIIQVLANALFSVLGNLLTTEDDPEIDSIPLEAKE